MAPLITILWEGQDDAEVRFVYDEDLVYLIKSVYGRRWHKEGKYWTIPASEIHAAAAMFCEEGCLVFLDEERWRPPIIETPVPSNRRDLIERLFQSIPDYLVQSTHRALMKAWHPDHGGDHNLTQDLNDVWTRSPKGL